MPRLADSDDDIARCHPVMAELRPHLDPAHLDPARFVTDVHELAQTGYRLAMHEADGEVVTVAGYRLLQNFHLGRHLYVEDLVTRDAARGAGHGRVMLDWLRDQARAAGCAHLDLLSGTQRTGAHRFYAREGMDIIAFAFVEALD
jgi:GNAT superfamily N-acetyltransferase